jgi:AcrR family transcriptional regulator
MRLLSELGPAGLTVEGVAREVGCAKASIYRRFGSREGLVLATAQTLFGPVSAPEEDNLVGAAARLWEAASEGEAFVPAASVLMAETSRRTELGRMCLEQIWMPMRIAGMQRLEAAVGRGELSSDADLDLVLDVLAGTALFRASRRTGPEPDLPARLVRLLTCGANGS